MVINARRVNGRFVGVVVVVCAKTRSDDLSDMVYGRHGVSRNQGKVSMETATFDADFSTWVERIGSSDPLDEASRRSTLL